MIWIKKIYRIKDKDILRWIRKRKYRRLGRDENDVKNGNMNKGKVNNDDG